MSNAVRIGKRIEKFRKKLALTRDDLSERTGLPARLLSDFEEGKVSPAIGVMIQLSRALGQRVGTFLDDHITSDPVITRSAEREEGTASHKDSTQGHYRYHSLGSGKTDRHMEPFFIRISAADEKNTSSHEGEEFVVVISGEIELQYGKSTHLLKEGDTMYYNSLVPHCLSAVGGDATIYAVIFTL